MLHSRTVDAPLLVTTSRPSPDTAKPCAPVTPNSVSSPTS
jgi:hypothetical protein